MNDFLEKYGKDSVNHRIGKLHQPGTNEEDISKVLDDPDEPWVVKYEAMQTPHFNKEHLKKILNNPDEDAHSQWISKESFKKHNRKRT